MVILVREKKVPPLLVRPLRGGGGGGKGLGGRTPSGGNCFAASLRKHTISAHEVKWII